MRRGARDRLLAGLALCAALAVAAVDARAQATRPGLLSSPTSVADAFRDLPIGGSPAAAAAAGTTQPAGAAVGQQPGAFDLTRVVVALGVVVVAILIAQRVWKKLGLPGAGTRGAGALSVVSRLTVSPKQQVLLVRVGRRVVLVGNSAGRMDRLCEIGDPDEVAALLGQTAADREDSASASFNEVLGGAEREFLEQGLPPAGEKGASEEAEAMAATRDELNNMMDKVRSLSKQFRRA